MFVGERGYGNEDVLVGPPAVVHVVWYRERLGFAELPVRREEQRLVVFEDGEGCRMRAGFEPQTIHEAIDEENGEGCTNVRTGCVVMEPEEDKASDLKDDMESEEDLVPSLPEAAKGCKIYEFVCDEGSKPKENYAVKQKLRECESKMSEHAVPNGYHAQEMQKSL